MQFHFFEDFFPELSDVIVHNRDFDKTGIDHLKDILGFKLFRCQLDLYRFLTRLGQFPIEALKAFVVA